MFLMNPYYNRQAAKAHGIWAGTLCRLMKSGSSEYIGRGRQLKMFTFEEDKRIKNILLEKNNGSDIVNMNMVKQIFDQEVELIKINEPHRQFDIKYPYLRNFVIRHNFKIKRSERSDRPKLFECDVCCAKFTMKKAMQIHQKRIHYSFLQ